MTLYKLQAPTSHWPLHIWGTMFLNTLADKFKAMLSLECLNNLVYSQVRTKKWKSGTARFLVRCPNGQREMVLPILPLPCRIRILTAS